MSRRIGHDPSKAQVMDHQEIDLQCVTDFFSTFLFYVQNCQISDFMGSFLKLFVMMPHK